MYKICIELNKIRKEKSIELEEKINKELQDLEMKNAKIKIDIQFDENKQYNKNGLNSVEFLIRTNVGEYYRALARRRPLQVACDENQRC